MNKMKLKILDHNLQTRYTVNKSMNNKKIECPMCIAGIPKKEIKVIAKDTETTFIEDVGVHVCHNCGAQATEIKEIKHYEICKPGESKKWEKYYNENPG